MGQSQEKIGIKEYLAIMILMVGTKLTDDTPAILFDNLRNAGWMGPLINGFIALILTYLLMRVVLSYENKNLIEVITHLFGKYLGYVVLFILWIISFGALTVDTAIYTDIIGTMYFTNTPTIVSYGVLMMVCAYGAKRGLEQIGSVAWAVFPYLQFILFVILVLTLTQGEYAFLTPILGPGGWEVVKESSFRLSIYFDILYLFLLVPFVKSKKDFKKGTWIAFIVIVVQLTITMIGYLVLFDYVSVEQLNYPFHELIRFIQIGIFGRVESFFFPFWLIASFVRFAAYLYLSAMLFGWLFKIEEFEYVIPTFATLIVLVGLIPESPTFAIFQLREAILKFSTPVFFMLPILLWMMAKLKGDLKHADNTNKK
ncbi:GerAB/ArcD/ProY family transporter [Oceanobacillus halotolerans]|uniref:GerAB/ArcD/ProY family transporter n=1 Tax=Oceanobacillus halotolerans TaxID=2663380 RepID=UPI0013DBF367|nr:endospore germination permease [Oceanobacillus halotolerans]